jgi:hypothetical protein
MVLSSFIALYSIAGGIFFFLYGQYFWFTYPGPSSLAAFLSRSACSLTLSTPL